MAHIRRYTIIGIILVLAGVTGGYLLGLKHVSPTANPDTVSGADSGNQQYTCGMHPFYVQEGPGTCPICGMNLTPVKGESKKKKGERKIKYWQAPHGPNLYTE